MKAGWELKPVAAFANTSAGGTPRKSNRAFYEGGDIPWLLSGEVANANIIEAANYITEEGLKGSSAKLFPPNSVLVAMYGATAGESGILRIEAATNQAVCAILPSEKYLPEYLYYFLLHAKPSLVAQAVGNAQPNISQTKIKALEVPLGPLEEQKRIVAVLDAAFEGLARARAHAETNLQNARELFASALQAAFQDESNSWNDALLCDLGEVITGSTPKTSDKENLGNYIPFVKPGDFLPDGSLVYDNQGLSEQGAAVSRVLPAGSTLMVCIGATIGKAGYSERAVATNQQINAVVPKSGISGEYLYYQMLTPEFQANVMLRAGQATLPIINKGKWSKLKVRMPSDLSKQSEIVCKLSEVRAKVDFASAHYQAQISDLDDLRQSLLQKAFAGELT
ncbi:restriction endonuclease subunit S [Thalassospira lucentensis]|uniref:restriction endonuclease subunit S n=1 Tax=Thalassospira lucentensis TaxID=168935 RepID=UPI003D2EEEA5